MIHLIKYVIKYMIQFVIYIIIYIIIYILLNTFMENYNNIKNKFKIIIYTFDNSDKSSGGINVLHTLYDILTRKGYNVVNYIYPTNMNTIKIDKDNDISIYPEIIDYNPFGTKKVIRWILAEIGFNKSKDVYKSWGKNDLVYYYNKEKKFEDNPEKIGTIYKQLAILVYSDKIKNFNHKQRKNMCHMFRKSHLHSEINYIHDSDSFEITNQNQDECIKIFNQYEYFISYDPLTFFSIIAGVCGCVSIVYPIKGMTKTEWLKKTIYWDYLEKNNINNMYGIAWGKEDIEYARSTLHLLPELMNNIKKYIDNTGTQTFLKDLDKYLNLENSNLENCNLENTVHNNYY